MAPENPAPFVVEKVPLMPVMSKTFGFAVLVSVNVPVLVIPIP
jgi:hypothetical protein